MHKIAANADRCVNAIDKQVNDETKAREDGEDETKPREYGEDETKPRDDGERNPTDGQLDASQGSSSSDATTLQLGGTPDRKDLDSPYKHVHGNWPARAGSLFR